jgi:hypothetical protein
MSTRFLAVPETAHRNIFASLRHWGHAMPEWHAVVESIPMPIKTVCGWPYTAEAHRTWDQTSADARCPQSDRLVAAVSTARGVTFKAEGARSAQRR